VRNRKVANARLKRELGYAFRYPTYVEGEQAIEAETAPADASPPSPAPASPPVAPPPVELPPSMSEPQRSTDPLRQLADRLAEAIALLDDGEADEARLRIERARELVEGIERKKPN
jgi:hypothetical protein